MFQVEGRMLEKGRKKDHKFRANPRLFFHLNAIALNVKHVRNFPIK